MSSHEHSAASIGASANISLRGQVVSALKSVVTTRLFELFNLRSLRRPAVTAPAYAYNDYVSRPALSTS
jgi:hypothetical protein